MFETANTVNESQKCDSYHDVTRYVTNCRGWADCSCHMHFRMGPKRDPGDTIQSSCDSRDNEASFSTQVARSMREAHGMNAGRRYFHHGSIETASSGCMLVVGKIIVYEPVRPSRGR